MTRATPARPAPDPLAMTAAEKAMCEWEARHDVARRGRSALAGPVQHYLSEAHSREACERAAEPPRAEPPRRPARPPSPPPHDPWWLRPVR
ncbi:hypothetical protein [Modestobacter sp. NPDC049651]|uniref:hypothetical protein n=1 Tax=unclassified Modestobacter TaxID=2643866 RepID=UPI00340BEF24